MKISLKNHLHIAIQKKIQALIPSKIHLEHHFGNHIADVFWEEEKIVFEIQCSPISLTKIKQRTVFYQSLGLSVIWILHEKTFNKKIISFAEQYLIKKKIVYYCNVTQLLDGIFYIQKKFSLSGNIVFKTPALEIILTKPVKTFWYRTYFPYTFDAKTTLNLWYRRKKNQKKLLRFFLKKILNNLKYYTFILYYKISI